MKKAANILFLVGAIVSIVAAVTALSTAIVFLVLGSSASLRDAIIASIESGQSSTDAASPEAAAQIVQLTFTCTGAMLLVPAVCAVPSAIFAFKARNTDNHAFFVLNIVFGLLSGVEVNVVGAIFALIKGDTIENAPEVTEVVE